MTFTSEPSVEGLWEWTKLHGASLIVYSTVQAALGAIASRVLEATAERACRQSRVPGLLTDCGESVDVCEFQQCQTSIAVASSLFPALFPTPLTAEICAAISSSGAFSEGEREEGEETVLKTTQIGIGELMRGSPMLRIYVSRARESGSARDEGDPLCSEGIILRCTQPADSVATLARKCILHVRTVSDRVTRLVDCHNNELVAVELCHPCVSKDVSSPSPVRDNRTAAGVLKRRLMADSCKRARTDAGSAVESIAEDFVARVPDTNASLGALPSVPPPSPLDPVLLFLGTGSAAPSRHRCNSAIAIKVPIASDLHAALLMDAGEGCASQLFQGVSGSQARFGEWLRALRFVWISHAHADHHSGLINLLEVRSRFRSESGDPNNDWGRVLVVAPPAVIRYHEYAACVAGLDEEVTFVSTMAFARWRSSDIAAATAGGLRFLTSVPVNHCRDSFGAVLVLSNGLKVVYSGDCRPSTELVACGQGCDLLIHEATFDDSLHDEAVCKRHCTTSEAINIGTAMRAKHIILTHFSQRYPKTPQSFVSTTSEGISEPFAVACDFLKVCVPSQLHCLPAVTAFLSSALSADDTDIPQQFIAEN